MELKFENVACRCLRNLVRESRNLEQTQELRLPEGLPDIGRVLCAWGQVMLRSKEWQGDGMTASGGVAVWVLYAPDDGSQPRCVDAWLPYQAKWSFPEAEREGVIRLVPTVRSVDARTVSARKLMVRANIGIWAEALEPFDAQVYTPGEMPEGIELLRNTYPVRMPKEAGEKTFLLDEELTMPGSCPPVEKLIRFELVPRLMDTRVMSGKVVFRGNGSLHILYRGKDGAFYTWDHEIPFSQFAELDEDFGTDAAARIAFALTDLELDLMDDGVLRLKCGIVAQYLIDDQIMLEVVEDAYSPQREVTPCCQNVAVPAVLDERAEQLNCEASLDAECGRIIDLCFLPDHPTVSRTGEQIRIGQNGMFQLLYEDITGNLQSTNRRWEQERTMDAAEDSAVYAEIRPSGASVAQQGGEIVMKSDMALTVHTETTRGQQMLCGIELGDVKKPDPNRPSLILRRTEGERLWDIAKICGTTVRDICRTNGLTDEPEAGRLLLIPVM